MRTAAGASTLVVDRNAVSGSDARLVAHLSAEEPAENVELVCRLYAAAEPDARRCRPLEHLDHLTDPAALRLEAAPGAIPADMSAVGSFRLARCSSRMSIPELRWTDSSPGPAGSQIVSLRDSIAAAEAYEPFRALTAAAIARHGEDQTVSTTTLRAELTRVLESPIVLNRLLREAVLARVGRDQSSLSEIAIRCGRVKSDSRGNTSGETSWLARRIGILPEGGQSTPTVWVHSDVLGLIAREGLGISPMEVELA